MIQDQLTKNRDWVSVVDGQEGEGKTTFAVNYCAWISPRFNIDNVCFGQQDFLENLKYSKPGDSILVDEGANFLFSRDAMQTATRNSIKIFTQVRFKSNHICIAIPNFHIIDSYLREHRTRSLVHIIQRGSYKAIIDQRCIKIISLKGMKGKNVGGIPLRSGTFFQGHFTKNFPITVSSEIYDGKKEKYVIDAIDSALEVTGQIAKDWMSYRDAAEIYGLTKNNIISIGNRGEARTKKIAGVRYVNKKDMDTMMERQVDEKDNNPGK